MTPPLQEEKFNNPNGAFNLWLKVVICFFGAGFLSVGLLGDEGQPIRALAQDHIIVKESPDAQNIPLYNPSIVALDSGRLVAAYMISGKFTDIRTTTHILTSDDAGKTWQERGTARMGQSRLITAGENVYLVGSARPMRIMRSTDNGTSWSAPSPIAEGHWHQSATNFIHANGNVYLAMEKRVSNDIDTWPPGEFAPILLRAKIGSDLLDPNSWTLSSELVFRDIIPGYVENKPKTNFFPVPFYPQEYPTRHHIVRSPQIPRSTAPMGWLETNVAQIKDPHHYWFDPSGRTFHLLMRTHTGGTGFATLAKVVEQDDGSMKTTLETVPSGKTALFLPLPGGQMRFHILYDEETALYWLLSSQSTDSMTRAELLPPDRYSLPNNERHRMVLHFSKNLVDWVFAGLVAKGDTPGQARHYAAMAIDGDDLVILSRSGDHRARNAHDGNLITFHRIQNFRDLIY